MSSSTSSAADSLQRLGSSDNSTIVATAPTVGNRGSNSAATTTVATIDDSCMCFSVSVPEAMAPSIGLCRLDNDSTIGYSCCAHDFSATMLSTLTLFPHSILNAAW